MGAPACHRQDEREGITTDDVAFPEADARVHSLQPQATNRARTTPANQRGPDTAPLTVRCASTSRTVKPAQSEGVDHCASSTCASWSARASRSTSMLCQTMFRSTPASSQSNVRIRIPQRARFSNEKVVELRPCALEDGPALRAAFRQNPDLKTQFGSAELATVDQARAHTDAQLPFTESRRWAITIDDAG